MLSKQDRQVVVKKLSQAFYRYRDMPIWLVCKREKIEVQKTPHRFGGSMHHNGLLEYPGKAPSIGKEDTFWHELCHWLLKGVLYRPMRIGYQAMLLEYEEIYWVHERLCDAFGGLMVLYRRGFITGKVNLEQWLFSDSSSIGYAEVTGASMRRIAKARDEAIVAGRNIDLSELDVLLEWMGRYRERVHFQPMLPTAFREHHQTPWPSYVDENKDLLVNERHWGKESWKWKHPIEQKILKRISSLKALEAQPRLFDHMTEADRQEFERQVEALDRYIKRF